jgi:hypothetical protein
MDRRALLRGALGGVAVQVALPTLEAMLNANGTALAQGQALPKRFGVWFWGNGMKPARWTPAVTGAGWQPSEQLAPLADVKDYVNVVTGMALKTGNPRGHHAGQVGIMSGAPLIPLPAGGGYASTFARPSLDQVAAAALGKDTRFKSLEVGVLTNNTYGEGDGLLVVSHNGPNSPNPPEPNPAKLFTRLFGSGTTAPSGTPVVDHSLALRKSVLDAVMADISSLSPKLGTADVSRLDQHLENIRGIERRLTAAPPATASKSCANPTAPTGYAGLKSIEGFTAVNKVMSDLVALAWACDLTRVVTLQYSSGGNHDVYAPMGSTVDNHTLNHDEPGDQPISNKITIFTMQQLAYFLQALKNTPDGTGNLLDGCSIFCTSEVSDGRAHSVNDYPILIAGRARGALKYPGIHYRSMTGENTSMPTLSALRAAGVPLTSFGTAGGATDTGLGAIEGA